MLALLLTEPGRAAVDWAAEQVGIGSEPSLEVRQTPNAGGGFSQPQGSTVEPDFSQRGPAVVIGVGKAPDGTPYEVVAYPAREATCVSLELPSIPRAQPSCYVEAPGRFERGESGASFPDRAEPRPREPIFEGVTGRDIDRVTIEYEDAASGVAGSTEAEVFKVDARAEEAIGAELEPLAVYVAFGEKGMKPASTSVVHLGFSADGQERWRLVQEAQPPTERGAGRTERQSEPELLALIDAGIESIESGDIGAKLDRGDALAVLRQLKAIELGEAPAPSGRKASRLEARAIAVFEALRESGDIPPLRP